MVDKMEDMQLSVDKADIRLMSTLAPAVSLLTLISDWIIIAAAIAIYLYVPNPIIYALCWLLIGTRMYALYSLLHDGMHYLLFPDRKWNDWLCRLFLAWPLFMSLVKIRKAHLTHHQYLKTDKDPEVAHLKYSEFQFPRYKRHLFLTLLADISGVNYMKYFAARLMRKNRTSYISEAAISIKYSSILYYAIIIYVIIYSGWEIEFIMFWLIPYVTIFQVLNRLRLSTEHFHIGQEKKFQTRSMKLNMLERFIFAPHNLGLHAEHHLYPSIPFYRLADLHQKLKNQAGYEKCIVLDKSYIEVIKKYTK